MVSLKKFSLFFAGLVPFAAAGPVRRDDGVSTLDVTDKYIIVLKENADSKSHLNWLNSVHKRNLNSRQFTGVEKTYEFGGFRGYAGKFDQSTLDEIKNNPDVRLFPTETLQCCTEMLTMPKGCGR